MTRTLPRRDIDLLQFAQNLGGRLAEDPAAYFTPPGEARDVLDAADAFGQALAVAGDANTNTSVSRERKRDARDVLERVTLAAARRVKGDSRVTSVARVAASLPPSGVVRRKSALQPPVDPPWLVVSEAGGTALRFTVAAAGGGGRPDGAAGFHVLAYPHDTGPRGNGDLGPTCAGVLLCASRRLRVEVDMAADRGREVWFRAAWLSPTLRPGPLSRAQRCRIPGDASSGTGRFVVTPVPVASAA